MTRKYVHVKSTSPVAKIETISGVEGMCLSLNDNRISGPKPWGGGRMLYACHPNKERLLKLIEGKDTVNIYVIDCGAKGFWIDGVNLSSKGSKVDLRKHLEKMEILKKRRSLKAAREYQQCCFRNVSTEEMRKHINDSYCKFI